MNTRSTGELINELHQHIADAFSTTHDTFNRHAYAVRFVTAAVEDIQTYLAGRGPMPVIQYESPVQDTAPLAETEGEVPRFLGKLAQDAPPPIPAPAFTRSAAGWPIRQDEQNATDWERDQLARQLAEQMQQNGKG